MSRKDRDKKQNVSVNNEEEKPKKNKEPMSKVEKMIYSIIMIVAMVAIVVIVLIYIPWGGEKECIARKYKVISKDNVYQYIEFDELRSKIQNGDEFHVLLVNKSQANYDDYVFYVDYIVKAFNEDSDSEIKIDTIYLFDTTNLSKEKYADQVKYLKKNIDKNILDNPNVVYYHKTINDYSADVNTTGRYDLSNYSGNIWKMIITYFYDCYAEE